MARARPRAVHQLRPDPGAALRLCGRRRARAPRRRFGGTYRARRLARGAEAQRRPTAVGRAHRGCRSEGVGMMLAFNSGRQGMSLLQKIWQINWSLVLLLLALAGIGFAMLYSAAGGALEPWASRQIARCAMGLVFMIVVAVVDIRFWMRWAYVGYAGAFLMLVAVELQGSIGMGAQRWLDLGVTQIQPSEIMKITLVL